ncbi:protein FAM153B-like isoform X4 [Symphalangus syndactylus]|uniref:protein FAM153B-like isoform X4 n=1 Tax=Symphalangus syndactylus TaxID=9590 RepID=UPI00300552E9
MRRTPGHDQDEDLAQETSSKDVPGVHMVDKATETNSDLGDREEAMPGQTSSEEATSVHMIHGDPATLEKILTKDLLQELSGYNGEEKDPEDVKKSSGVIQKGTYWGTPLILMSNPDDEECGIVSLAFL